MLFKRKRFEGWRRGAGLALLVLLITSLSANAANPSNHAADVSEIKAQVAAYTQAFAAGDSGKLSNMWADNAVFMDQFGNIYRGRDAIRKQYASFFDKYGGQAIEIKVEEISFPTDDTAIEVGVSRLSKFSSANSRARYVATHIKRDGKWAMQSVSESNYKTSNNGEFLEPLAWLQGSWKAEGPQGVLRFKSKWANKNVLSNEFELQAKDGRRSSQTEYIYWNPIVGQICSWQFDSSGATSKSRWEQQGQDWILHSISMEPDGAISRADYKMKFVDCDNFLWQSKKRSVDGIALPDTEAIKVTRDKG